MRCLCIDKNNILKSINDKLYVYKFDPTTSGISTDRNTKLVTIGTQSIKRYSDLPASMTERCDNSLITLSGTFELKPRIEINGIYYYIKYSTPDLDHSLDILYKDVKTSNTYVYTGPKTRELERIDGELHYTQFDSVESGVIDPVMNVRYYDRNTEQNYRWNESYLEEIPELPFDNVDKGTCMTPEFFIGFDKIPSSDRYLYHDNHSNKHYIYYEDEFLEVEILNKDEVDWTKNAVYRDGPKIYLYLANELTQVNIIAGIYKDGKFSNTLSNYEFPFDKIEESPNKLAHIKVDDLLIDGTNWEEDEPPYPDVPVNSYSKIVTTSILPITGDLVVLLLPTSQLDEYEMAKYEVFISDVQGSQIRLTCTRIPVTTFRIRLAAYSVQDYEKNIDRFEVYLPRDGWNKDTKTIMTSTPYMGDINDLVVASKIVDQETLDRCNWSEVRFNTVGKDYITFKCEVIPTRDLFIPIEIFNTGEESYLITNTFSTFDDPTKVPLDNIVYWDTESKGYYKYISRSYLSEEIVNCFMECGIPYLDPEHTIELTPEENMPYMDLTTRKYFRWKGSSLSYTDVVLGYRDDQKFYDMKNSICVPKIDTLYKDTSNNRYYIYNRVRYTQQTVIDGYLHDGILYEDESLLKPIDMSSGPAYHDLIEDKYFYYYPGTWTELDRVEGYLSNGIFYHDEEPYPGYFNRLYFDIGLGIYYLFEYGKYSPISKLDCYVEGNEVIRFRSNKDVFLYSCIISEDYTLPEYNVVETGEYCIVPNHYEVDRYIDFVNDKSESLFLTKSGNDEDYLQVTNIFGINLKDTVLHHRFNDISPYGKNQRVLLDEKMQVAQWVRSLREMYPSIVFYNDPNDRGPKSTHSNEFIFYQAKLFSDDSAFTTPLRYRDSKYGKVRAYDIPIFVRYECPDMITYLNRRNEFLMHDFLSPLQLLDITLSNGDLVHIGVSWTRAIREEEPDKSVDASERNVYTFITNCNLNALLLERNEELIPISEVIANIYSVSDSSKLGKMIIS